MTADRFASLSSARRAAASTAATHRLHPARRGARACTRSAASAPSASCRTSTTWCSSARRCRAIRSRAIARSAHTKTVLGTRFATKPIELDIPITIAGMSFGALSANVKEALGRAATAVGTSTTTGDGGMTQRGAQLVEDAGLPVPAVALRLQSRRPAPRRRHRGRDRPGRQARRRRHAAGPEDEPARGEDAHAAGRRRPALGLPPSRTGPARTTWRSRSTSCARSPTGRSRST